MIRLLMEADGQTVWDQITTHLRDGISLRSLGDAIQLGAAELVLRTTIPRKFTEGQHPFDYCNTANYWMRTSDNPYQPRILYLMANFVNDAARANKLFSSVIEQEFASHDLNGRTPEALLREQDEAIMAFDFARATAVANAYLQTGADRSEAAGGSRGDRLQVPGRSAQPEDQPLDVRGVWPQFHPSARPAVAGHRAAARRLAEDAGRARLLCSLHEGVDQALKEERPWPARITSSMPMDTFWSR